MKKFPNNVTFTRPHKVKIIKGLKRQKLSHYTVGLRLERASYITYAQLESTRRSITRLVKPKEVKNKKHSKNIASSRKKERRNVRRPKAKQKRFLFIRSNLCLPLTKKPLQVRMGKGKGNVDSWIYPAKASSVIMELSRQRLKLRKIYRLFHKSLYKLPKKAKITYSRFYSRRESNFRLKRS